MAEDRRAGSLGIEILLGREIGKGCTIQGRVNVRIEREEVSDGRSSTIVCLGRWTHRWHLFTVSKAFGST